MGLFHSNGPGEEDVILQMNVLMQVSLKLRQSLVESLIADAGVRWRGIAVTDFPHGAQGVTGRIVLVLHHRHRVLDGAEVRRQNWRLFDDGLFHPNDVREQNLFFFQQVDRQFPVSGW